MALGIELDRKKVRDLRRERGLTQDRVAELVGRTRTHVSRIEREAGYRVGPETAKRLAVVLEASLDSLRVTQHRGFVAAAPHLRRTSLAQLLAELIEAQISEEVDLSQEERALVAGYLVREARDVISLVKAARAAGMQGSE